MRIGRHHFRLNALIGCIFVGILLLSIAVGFAWMPYDPIAIDLDHTLAPPSMAHWLGSDEFGRDVLSRAMLGARISASIAFEATLGALVIGAALGILTGFVRGWTDRLVMMVNDAMLALPGILLALGLIAVLGSGRSSIVLALTLAYLPSVVRVIRGAVLSIRQREYIEASQVAGNSTLYTMGRHVLPNVLPPIIVLGTSVFGWVVLSESALSFLGVGVPPPAPTWGDMLSSSRPYMENATWLSIVPGLCIAFTLLGINLFGDALRDWLDPRNKESA
ncbi:ABC transporter permease [Terriglobus saanensis]|uniref:Binding-protein-dependent transport systems inner membrane component n=1 Tax=Terriglobus saanensis (strain ATCC BAA-1853 / DSM 23119 / SP1PR4) TaxID=401053 RepID=E8V3F6_TERSS|nr:ABC transporter permease [Terriglobus saanensis]ADV83569.1 binding-protein-dependent transport systems inner membrane component [Terriglobus saanensis SP1PR4]